MDHRCPLAVSTQGVISAIDFLCAGLVGVRDFVLRLSLFMNPPKLNLENGPDTALCAFPFRFIATFFIEKVAYRKGQDGIGALGKQADSNVVEIHSSPPVDGQTCSNHGPARVIKIILPPQIDTPSQVFGNRGIIFVPKGITAKGEMLVFPADSLRIGIHPEKIESKPIPAVAVEPKNTVKVVLEVQATWKRLFESYHLASPAVVDGQPIMHDTAARS